MDICCKNVVNYLKSKMPEFPQLESERDWLTGGWWHVESRQQSLCESYGTSVNYRRHNLLMRHNWMSPI